MNEATLTAMTTTIAATVKLSVKKFTVAPLYIDYMLLQSKNNCSGSYNCSSSKGHGNSYRSCYRSIGSQVSTTHSSNITEDSGPYKDVLIDTTV